MLKKILLVLVAVLAIFVGYVATRPAEFRIERSISMRSAPFVPYAMVADFHRWDSWSPWAHLDPGIKVEFAGPESGKGAVYSWKGNDKVGEGRMTIIEANPAKRLDITLEFIKPWEQKSLTRFNFEREKGNRTKVTWIMSGERDFVGKLFGLFMDMDKMVGPDFEKGLQALKTQSEALDD
jgi:hypothetical protein